MDHPTTLLDLPDELLAQILAEVKWDAPAPTFPLEGLDIFENLMHNTCHIQSVRLTCRRFASLATPLLLPVASVSIHDQASVDTFERIASDPAFAPHVRAVRVHFDAYESGPAKELRALAELLVYVWRASPLLQDSAWAHVFKDWAAFSQDGDQSQLAPESMVRLCREHVEYQRRYCAQEALLPTVLDRIATATARMARATRLILDDGPETLPASAAVPAAAGGFLTTPTSWTTAFKLGRGAPPIDALFSLPAAVHRAGVRLTGLRIRRIRLPANFPLWVAPGRDWDDPPPPEAAALTAACRSLRVLDFTPGYEADCWPSASPTHLEWPGWSTSPDPYVCVGDVLGWLLSRSSELTHVRVDLSVARLGGDVPSFELAMPAPPLPWPRVRVLHLSDGDVEAITLAQFLAAAGRSLEELRLDRMRLCSKAVGGWPYTLAQFSWAAVLDRLRAHVGGSGGRLRIRVRSPDGAEFEDEGVSEEDMRIVTGLFEEGETGLSAVGGYLQGLRDDNPIVAAGKTKPFYGT
ncbi:hypothetical protein C8A05DRAFT_19372 [Staphylotrichum tortipilum]|uniref:Uncharacterized protein n=1 Tax=Staphylotrichum tortipilum TaxID=2831512 RepID=A0AAN6MBR7_9PEZI|nr:hypothetical protein C8A05DRAFT_19372 [Staphylotrichum longicolle]